MNLKKMTLKRVIVTLAVCAGGLTSMTGNASTKTPDPKTPGAPWFEGTVEEAFSKAKRERRSVFLYWGAVWCPPCNYLKSQVFDAPRFSQIMEPAVAVYLDGDSERAQEYGAKFKAEGYPTMILFDADGAETMRLDHTMNLGEFEQVISAALARPANLKEVLANARAGKAKDSDWNILTGVYWSGIDENLYPEAEHVRDRLALFDLVPKTRSHVRARLAAGLLESGLGARGDKERKETEEAVRGCAADLFAAVFQDDEAMFAARELIAYMHQEYITWLFPQNSTARTALINTWRTGHKSLRQRKDGSKVSADILMGVAMGDIRLHELQQDSGKPLPVPADLKDAVRAAVTRADKESVSAHQRISAIPSAAYYLREIGDIAQARTLLDKELKTTDVPWYYQSSYASLERAAGNEEKALYWAGQARQSAKGRASRIQWTLNEISLVAKSGVSDKDQRLMRLLTEYYDTAFTLADGFSGRNAQRMQSVAKILKPLQEKKDFAELARKYARRCGESPAKAACSAHFADFTSGLQL